MNAPEEVDVLIIGAGINGAGLFRDLCEQGLKVAIVDKADFGSGTSAAPSRLIHGGIKYLETGEFRLVAQSTLERNLLLRNAPHSVKPLPTVIPIFSWVKGIGAALRTLAGSTTAPRNRGALLIKIGLALYDFYGARQRIMPRHSVWSRARALREIAPLTPDIVAAGAYYDAKVNYPERLVLELIKDGARASPGSVAMNYAKFLDSDGDVLRYESSAGAAVALRPRIVVNATGPWIDQVNAALGAPSNLIGGTKGSHIVLDHPELVRALNGRMIYYEADDGRICLVYDYLGRALVGSTDIRADNPDTVRCDDDEIDYLLQSLRRLLPGLRFDYGQVVFTYAGIRPLPTADASAPGLISRDHSAPVFEPDSTRKWPVISLVGGKWTTFRGFAEEVADVILDRLAKARRRSTRHLPIGGGRGYPTDLAARDRWIDDVELATGSDRARVTVLLERYGSTAESILRQEQSDGVTTLECVPDYTLAELKWIARHESVVHLSDLLFRRTSLAITGRLDRRAVETVAGAIASILGWDHGRRVNETGKAFYALDASRWRSVDR